MAVVDKAAFQAQKDLDYADNTNEDITASIQRGTFEDLSDSVPFGAADESIEGNWTFDNPVVGALPTASNHLGTKEYIDTSNEAVQATGLQWGGVITVNVDPAKIDISAGEATILDEADPENPVYTQISWTAQVGLSTLDANATNFFYFDVSSGNTVEQTLTFPTREGRSTIIGIGTASYASGVLTAFQQDRDFTRQYTMQMRAISEAIGLVKLSGLVVSANGANLMVDRSAGTIFSYGSNGEPTPHSKNFTLNTATEFLLINQTSSSIITTQDIDPDQWDNGGTLTSVPNNLYTVQHIFLFPGGTEVIQYGQATYSSEDEALQAIGTFVFVTAPQLQFALRLGYLIVQEGETDLTNASFVQANKFGSIGGGVSGTPGALISANNLSDLANVVTALSNILAGSGLSFSGTEASFSGDVIKTGANNTQLVSSIVSLYQPTLTFHAWSGSVLEQWSSRIFQEGSGGLKIQTATLTANIGSEILVDRIIILPEGDVEVTGTLSTSDTTEATSTTVASLKTAGGLAVAKKLKVGGDTLLINLEAKTGTFTGSFASPVLVEITTSSSVAIEYANADGSVFAGANSDYNFAINDVENLDTDTALEIDPSSGDMNIKGHISYHTRIITKTDDYTILAADNGAILEFNGVTDKEFEMPLASTLSDGWSIQVVNRTTDVLTLNVNATDLKVINSKGAANPNLESQWGGCTVYYNGTDFTAIGDLT